MDITILRGHVKEVFNPLWVSQAYICGRDSGNVVSNAIRERHQRLAVRVIRLGGLRLNADVVEVQFRRLIVRIVRHHFDLRTGFIDKEF